MVLGAVCFDVLLCTSVHTCLSILSLSLSAMDANHAICMNKHKEKECV